MTPQERASLDQTFAAVRNCTAAFQNLTLSAMGATKRFAELNRLLLEQEQREFIRIASGY